MINQEVSESGDAFELANASILDAFLAIMEGFGLHLEDLPENVNSALRIAFFAGFGNAYAISSLIDELDDEATIERLTYNLGVNLDFVKAYLSHYDESQLAFHLFDGQEKGKNQKEGYTLQIKFTPKFDELVRQLSEESACHSVEHYLETFVYERLKHEKYENENRKQYEKRSLSEISSNQTIAESLKLISELLQDRKGLVSQMSAGLTTAEACLGVNTSEQLGSFISENSGTEEI